MQGLLPVFLWVLHTDDTARERAMLVSSIIYHALMVPKLIGSLVIVGV